MATTTTCSPSIRPETTTRPAARDLITLPVIFVYLWTFIHIGRPQDVFPALHAFNPGDIAAALSILSFGFWGEKDRPFFSLSETKLFILFFVISILSVPYSYHRQVSIDFIIAFFGKIGLYIYITTKLITTERRIDGLINTIMLSGFLMAVATTLTQQPGIRAAVGATYDPNDMALLMVVTIPMALTQGLAGTKLSWKVLCYICVAFCLVALLATVSRGGFLGLLAVAYFILKTNMPGLPKKKVIFLGAVFGMFFILSMGGEFSERMSTITEDVSSDRAGSGRILIWKRSLVLAKDHLFLGVGPNCFQSAYGTYLGEGFFKGLLAPMPGEWAAYKWAVAHSAYLTVLVELGIPGFLVYIAFIIRTFRNITNLDLNILDERAQTQLSLLSAGVKISYVGLLICIVFLSQAYTPLFFLYCFVSRNIFVLGRARNII